MSWPEESKKWEKRECDDYIIKITNHLIDEGFENIELDRKELLTGRIQIIHKLSYKNFLTNMEIMEEFLLFTKNFQIDNTIKLFYKSFYGE